MLPSARALAPPVRAALVSAKLAVISRCHGLDRMNAHTLVVSLLLAGCGHDKGTPAEVEASGGGSTEVATPAPPSSEEGVWCWDGEDNDEDGPADCDDPDCADSVGCFAYGECDKDWKAKDLEEVIAEFDVASLYDGEETVRFFSCSAWGFERDFNECIDGAHQWEEVVYDAIVEGALEGTVLDDYCDLDVSTVCGPLSPAEAAEVTGDQDELWCCYAMKVQVECSL